MNRQSSTSTPQFGSIQTISLLTASVAPPKSASRMSKVQSAISTRPFESIQNTVSAFLGRGSFARERINDIDGAIRDYDVEFVRLEPKEVVGYSSRGGVKLQNKDYQGA